MIFYKGVHFVKTVFLLKQRLYRKYVQKNKCFRVKRGIPFSLRNWQMFRFSKEEIVYVYEFNEDGYSRIVDTFVVPFSKIEKILYDKRKHLAIVYGDIARTKNINCLHEDEKCKFFEFLDCFEEEIVE